MLNHFGFKPQSWSSHSLDFLNEAQYIHHSPTIRSLSWISTINFPIPRSCSTRLFLRSAPVRTSISPSPNHQQAWLQEVYLDMMYCQPWGGFESFCHILLFLLFFPSPIAVVCSPSCSGIVLTVFSSCSLSKQSVNHRAEWMTVHPCNRDERESSG